MICPFCKTKLKEDVGVCPVCGVNLINMSKDITHPESKSKYFLVTIVVIISLFFFGAGGFIVINDYLSNRKDDVGGFNSKGGLLMRIQDIYVLPSKGIVSVGTIKRGKVKKGDKIEIISNGGKRLKTTVTAVIKDKKEIDGAKKGDLANVLLSDITRDDIEIDYVICKPNSIKTSKTMTGVINVKHHGKSPYTIKNDDPFEFSFMLTDITGTINFFDKKSMKSGDIGQVYINLDEEVPIEVGTEFTIKKSGRLIATGKVQELLDDKDADDLALNP